MSYIANQYNYATPLSSVAALFGEQSSVVDIKYFTLSENTLDGSYYPIAGDVGLWGAAASDANGVLANPFIVTITGDTVINAIRLVGSQYCYPVAFTVKFYSGTTLLYTLTETSNNNVEYIGPLPKTLSVTHYEISITKISKANSAARLYNVYEPAYVRRVDTLAINTDDIGTASQGLFKSSSDTLKIGAISSSLSDAPTVITVHATDTFSIKETSITTGHVAASASDRLSIKTRDVDTIRNVIDVTTDSLRMRNTNASSIVNTIDVTTDIAFTKVVEDISHVTNIFDTIHSDILVDSVDTPTLTNVHTRMKDATRRVYGKTYITYTDPMLENETVVSSSADAYNSNKEQVMDGTMTSNDLFFTLYDNDLSGDYKLMSEDSQVGWVSSVVGNDAGIFDEPPYLRIDFSTRPITPLTIYFDDSHGNTATEFSVEFVRKDAEEVEGLFFKGNTSNAVLINEEVEDAVDAVIIRVYKVLKPNFPISIIEVPILSTLLYRGYADASDLMSIDMLEELTYEDEVEALGGVSANEVTVTIDNSKREFYFNNNSVVSKQLRRNRRIEPWLGTEIVPGEIEWYRLGTYWSYSWDVPVNSLTAKVVGFDTLGLLDTTNFEHHYVQVNSTLGDLIEYVLNDAKQSLYFITWKIDEALYDVIVPYAWFEAASHTAALRKISQSYPMHIYCDRDGTICAAPQKLKLDYYYDTWSDSTNVISKEYSSLHTTLPNIVNVTVNVPLLTDSDNLVQDSLVFDVSTTPTRTLNFGKPYLSNISIEIDKDDTVSYTYNVYSWGIEFTFTGTGNVRSINCVGTSVDISNTSMLTRKNAESIRTDGAITRDVAADFIQTADIANIILDRIFALSAYDKFDATVTYRGDIALSINDPIRLLDGIAPDNRYNIRRHELSWNGALSGSADLNT